MNADVHGPSELRTDEEEYEDERDCRDFRVMRRRI